MRGSGGEAGDDVVAGGVGGGAHAGFCGDGGVREGCAGGIENGAFDVEAIGAALRVGRKRGQGEADGQSCDEGRDAPVPD